MGTWNPFDAGTFEVANKIAEEQSERAYFGLLSGGVEYLHIVDRVGIPISATEYLTHARERGYLQKLHMTIDSTPFDPNGKAINRSVTMGPRDKIKGTEKWVRGDWVETVLPSIVKVFGSPPEFGNRLNEGKTYVKAVGVPQKGDPEWDTFCFVEIFPSAQQCAAAWKERYGANGVTQPAPNTSGIPDAVLQQAKGIAALPGMTQENLKTVFASSPEFNKYPADVLLAAVKV